MNPTSLLLALALAFACSTAIGAELRGTTMISAVETSGQTVVYWVPSRSDADAPGTGVAHIHVPDTGAKSDLQPTTYVEDALAPVAGPAAVPVPAYKPRIRRQLPREAICNMIEEAAEEHELPIDFLARLIWQESRFKVTAVSHAGAQGIAQFMPATAAERKLKDPFDPQQAIRAAASLLSSLKERFGNLGLAAAAYNAGPGRIAAWLQKKGALPEETRHYVSAITGQPPSSWAESSKGSLDFVNDETANADCLATVIQVAARG